MALELVVEKLESVAEEVRGLYVEKDGKFHLDVTGIEDNSGLKSALQKERDAAKTATKTLKEFQERFAGIDPDKVKAMLGKIDNDEEAALIAAGKIDEVVNKRSEKLRADLQRKVDEAAQHTQAAMDRASKFSQRVLDNHIRAAATKAGLHAHAVEDALFRARAMFSLDDNGDPIQMDSSGHPVLGKDGKTPFSPLEWLESMKETAPHWFPAGGSGSGAGGSGSGAGSAGKTITRAAFDALSPAEKVSTVKTHTITD
jgi:hypothetical protein